MRTKADFNGTLICAAPLMYDLCFLQHKLSMTLLTGNINCAIIKGIENGSDTCRFPGRRCVKIYTIKDIARKAEVSVTTVSRVLNKRPDVNQATREKVERVMAECHFVGNANARGLKQTEGDTVAIILRGRDNPFLNALAASLLEYAKGHDASFLMEYVDERADEFETALRLSHEKRVNGFIFLGGHIDERARVMEGVDVPMVFATISAAHAGFSRAGSVCSNDREMGRMAMQTLLDAGHRRIAIFGGSREGSDGFALRYQGAMDALSAVRLPFDDSRYINTRFSLTGSYEIAKDFFAAHPEVTGVFAMSDTVAMGVIRALADMGRSVPKDVSVVGFDGIEMSNYFIPRLTTVAQPVQSIAKECITMLTGMLENQSEPSHITVDASLILRESVGKCPDTI